MPRKNRPLIGIGESIQTPKENEMLSPTAADIRETEEKKEKIEIKVPTKITKKIRKRFRQVLLYNLVNGRNDEIRWSGDGWVNVTLTNEDLEQFDLPTKFLGVVIKGRLLHTKFKTKLVLKKIQLF